MVNKFYVDGKMHKLFKEITEEPHSPFYKKDIKDVFIFSLALGFILGKRIKLEGRKDIADIDVFTEKQILLIKSIAIKITKELEILIDEKEIFKIAEEYANGGIPLLYELIFKNKDPIKALDKKIVSLAEKKK